MFQLQLQLRRQKHLLKHGHMTPTYIEGKEVWIVLSVSDTMFKRSSLEVALDCLPNLGWPGLQVLEAYALNEPPPEFNVLNDETQPDTNGMKTQMDSIISFRVC